MHKMGLALPLAPLPVSMAENPLNPNSAARRSAYEAPGSLDSAGASQASDEVLMARIAARDREAMGQLFDRYGRLVYSVALRVLKDPGQAEDVMQEILLQVWNGPATLAQARGSVGAWLAVVARNRAIDVLRRRRPSDSVDDVVLAASGDLASEVERNRMIEKVRGVLSKLPQEQQRSVDMAFFEGLTHAEIAAKTGDPLGTVKTRIRSALIGLRKGLEA